MAALKALHVAEGLEIRPETNVIWWQGERWDLGWAVESLQSYKGSANEANETNEIHCLRSPKSGG